ncbi:MAG: hypothetical protein IJ026_05645 [Candidatus Methanomethylophilaceae archaeon]|nr:hypothetical protein [Candidatus Methanomethylophilaceae archaeon]
MSILWTYISMMLGARLVLPVLMAVITAVFLILILVLVRVREWMGWDTEGDE